MLRILFHPFRIAKIGWILARFDCLFWPALTGDSRLLRGLLRVFRKSGLPERPGQRLALAMGGLGPTFIKLGQALSTRGDVFGEEVATDLSELQEAEHGGGAGSSRGAGSNSLGRSGVTSQVPSLEHD